MSDDAPAAPLRLLHLSDLHFREGRDWLRDPMLAALARRVAQLRDEGLAPDLIAVTGDVAFAGKAGEYAQSEARRLRPRRNYVMLFCFLTAAWVTR